MLIQDIFSDRKGRRYFFNKKQKKKKKKIFVFGRKIYCQESCCLIGNGLSDVSWISYFFVIINEDCFMTKVNFISGGGP